MLESVLYDVSDFTERLTMPQIETFFRDIDRQTWNDAGGPGALTYYEPARALAVVQTAVVHKKIKAALAQARGLKPARPAPVKKAAMPALREKDAL